jgi:pimeloyl-ACP methyl ester carboxylesterase
MATFVLVHGAWAGSIVWKPIEPRLRAAGHEVLRPTLTGLGERKHLVNRSVNLDTHIQDVVGVIDYEDLADIVLVGHSYGGMVVTGVADRVPDKTASLVYLDAFLPESGQSLASLAPNLPGQAQPPAPTAATEDWLTPPLPPGAFEVTDPQLQRFMETKTAPQPTACFTQPVTLTGGIDRIGKKTYILATKPPLFKAFHDKVASKPGWTVHSLPCTHMVQVDMPEELTTLLLGAIP